KELCRAAIQCTNYNDALSAQQSAGLCFQILAQVWRDAHTPARCDPDVSILRLMDRLREQPSQRLSLEEMAEETHLSVAQFNRRFFALSGETPVNFAIRQRINHAKHYLHGSSLQISEIANALGYSDIYFFSRQFKKDTGMSPSAYRSELAKTNKELPTTS
ncbi:MAG TPA: AraC family transcriptional regulator, partial [Opitutales bacterium]|nr:AraC family transcriptional regulator [Opitutales bacterium]